MLLMGDQDISQLLLDLELDWLTLPKLQVAMLEYLEAQVTMFTLDLILLERMPTVKQQIIDGSQLMDAPTKLSKAKIVKEMFIKFIDGLMKDKDLMRQIIGLALKAMFTNATDGLMIKKSFTKLFKLLNAMDLLSLSTLLKTDMELSEESIPFLSDNTELAKNTDRMAFTQLSHLPFPHKLPKQESYQQQM